VSLYIFITAKLAEKVLLATKELIGLLLIAILLKFEIIN